MVQMRRVQVRLDDKNARQLKAVLRSLNDRSWVKTSLAGLINLILEKHGTPEFIRSELYKNGLK